MAVERFLIGLFGLFAHPKKVIDVDEKALRHLDGKTAHILYAVAEAVIGEDFRAKVPNFIPMIDDYLGYQRQTQRELLSAGLLLVENAFFNYRRGGRLHGFSHLSLADRQVLLGRLKASDREQDLNLYAACVNISASAYYASPATWGEILYDGVSVEHPELLTQMPVPWRPNDPRPIEP